MLRPIAISGRAGTGKTTLAEAIVELVPELRRASLAEGLKADLATLGVVKGQPFARETMIAYGQNRRAAAPLHWVEALYRREGGFEGLVVDDVRFANELETLTRAGAIIVRLWAPERVRAERLGLDELDPFLTSADPSEAELDRLEPEDVDVFECTARLSADLIAELVVQAWKARS